MADITGNFGVNAHGYTNDKIGKKASVPAQNAAHEDEVKKSEINLDKSPAAISGKTLVKTSSVGKKGESYQFDPKKVEDDVLEFQALYAVKEVLEEYKNELIKKGYDPVAAEDKAMMFAHCLIGAQNV